MKKNTTKYTLITALFIPIFSIFFITNSVNAGILPNLILNPQLTTVDSVDSTKPQDWTKGVQWGSNIPTYEYSTINNVISASFPSYVGTPDVGGDAKWYFTPVPVTAGRQYTFSDSYISDTVTYLTAEFFSADHTHLAFGGFVAIPATVDLTTWKVASTIFTAPAGAAYMTVFHTIQNVGKLTTDDYILNEVPLPSPFSEGFISLTFDDGYINHITNAKTILDTTGLKGTFYIISHVSGFSIINPSMEIVDPENISRPLDWTPNTPTGSSSAYPVTGHTGSNAVQVNSTVPGTLASWYFTPVSVLADEDFVFGEYYKSTATSAVYVKIFTKTGEIKYLDDTGAIVSIETPFMSGIAPASSWTKLDTTFYLPPEVKSITVIHALEGVGSLTVDDVTLGAFTDFANSAQIKSLETAGHEVGGHTQTHADLTAISTPEATVEVAGGRSDLTNGGITSVSSFAYPYGNFNDNIKTIIKNSGFASGRTVLEGLNGKDSDKFALLTRSVNRDTTVAQVKAWIDQAVLEKRWLILVFHQVQDNIDSPVLDYGTTISNFTQILAYLNANHTTVHTVKEGVALMDGGSVVILPPTIDTNSDIKFETTNVAGTIATYTIPAARDGQNNPLVPICTPASGSTFLIGTTTVSCTATDQFNTSVTSTFNVIVKLSTPIIDTPPTIDDLISKTGSSQNTSGGSGGSISRASGRRMYSILDFNMLIINWNRSGINIPGDFDLSGTVDILDFNMMISNWAI